MAEVITLLIHRR